MLNNFTEYDDSNAVTMLSTTVIRLFSLLKNFWPEKRKENILLEQILQPLKYTSQLKIDKKF